MAGTFDSLVLYLFGFIGIALIFLTRYVLKGRSRDMTNLWFVTFFAFFIYYTLASGKIFTNDAGAVIGYAIIWPIASILAFWTADKLWDKENTKLPVIKWLAYILFGIVFAFLVDMGATFFNWYSYVDFGSLSTIMTNPLTNAKFPAVVPLVLGILMTVLCEMVDRIKRMKGAKAYTTQNMLIISGIAVFLGAVAWSLIGIVLGKM